jgi:hypothetical protein
MRAIPIRTVFLTSAAAIAAAFLFLPAEKAVAASSAGCEGGGFVIRQLVDGTTVGEGDTTIPASNLGAVFLVDGLYNEFIVVSSTFGIRNWAFTGAPNPLDITGGRRTPVWAEKTPNHRGLVLNTAVEVESDGPDLVITRSGTGGLTMKIQAQDCANGGNFQMEVERGDHTTTLYTHVLDPEAFYFDNPNFRAREGDLVPYKDILIPVPARVNIANDFSKKFVARDSAQVAVRRDEPNCRNEIPRIRLGGIAIVLHCGGVTRWDVASGGRMGFVTGEDAVEVAPGATDCIKDCQAQNRVRGRSVKLGFPFPVPARVRLQPRTPF